MKFMLLIYTDAELLDALPEGEADAMMRNCFDHADELQRSGHLIQSQQLEEPRTARSVRIRKGRTTTTDGPFTEAKEMLGGFNLIEARDMDEAVRIASEFPWARDRLRRDPSRAGPRQRSAARGRAERAHGPGGGGGVKRTTRRHAWMKIWRGCRVRR